MIRFPKMGVSAPSLKGKGGCYCGRRGLPREWVLAMFADYKRLGSLSKVAALHGRTRQNMFDIFKARGLKMNARNFQSVVEYNGRKYTCQKTCGRHRYLRDTINRRPPYYLHHIVWIENHGAIPRGHKVVFRDGNHLNCDIANLELLTNSDQVRRHATGANGATKTAPARLALLLAGKGKQAALLKEAA